MPAPTAYPPGKQIDQYSIIRTLGQGMANQVYLAYDLPNRQKVILKCPRQDVIGGAGIFAAYRQEAQVGKLLHHPFLQSLLYQNEEPGQEYLVFEYIPGQVLRKVLNAPLDLLRSGVYTFPIGEQQESMSSLDPLEGTESDSVMPAEKAVPLLLPICSVLAYVHAHGVIHRDVKPENILLGDDGSIRLLDFGISLFKDKIPPRKRWKLRLPFSAVVGTPLYMSPERLRGEPGDERGDIYAVGAVLYEMLCGHTPFEDADGFAIIELQMAFDPPDIRKQNSTVPPALATVIMRAIRRDPDKRYASMQNLLDDLSNLDKITPEDYIPDRPLFGGRYRQVLQVIVIILLILTAITAFGFVIQLLHQSAG